MKEAPIVDVQVLELEQEEPVDDELLLNSKQRKLNTAKRNRLVEKNLLFAYWLASRPKQKQRLYSKSDPSMSMEDLKQNAALGLIEGVAGFDPSQGCQISSYVEDWIKRRLRSTLGPESAGLPERVFFRILKFLEIKKRLETDNEYRATNEEVAQEMGLNDEELQNLLSGMKFLHHPLSLDCAIEIQEQNSNGDTYLDELADNDAFFDIEEREQERQRKKFVRRLLEHLPFEDRMMTMLYYGIAPYREHSMDEVGTIFDLSRQRVQKCLEEIYWNLRTRKIFTEAHKYCDGLPQEGTFSLYKKVRRDRRKITEREAQKVIKHRAVQFGFSSLADASTSDPCNRNQFLADLYINHKLPAEKIASALGLKNPMEVLEAVVLARGDLPLDENLG